MAKKITLTWKDNCSFEDGFKIERSANGLTGWSVIDSIAANSETYEDTNVDFGETWYYRVRAFDGSVLSAYTNVATATVPDVIDPADLSDLITLFDSDTSFPYGSVSHNDPVGSFPDLSGNGYNIGAAGSLRPLIKKTSGQSPNNLVLVEWDGVDDVMDSVTPSDWPSLTNGYTYGWYGRLKQPTTFGVLIRDPNTTRPQFGLAKSAGSFPYVRSEADGTAIKDLHNAAIGDTRMQFFAIVLNAGGSLVQAYRAIGQGAVTALSENPTFTMGSLVNKTGMEIGIQCPIALANHFWRARATTLSDLSLIRAFLMDKYGEET